MSASTVKPFLGFDEKQTSFFGENSSTDSRSGQTLYTTFAILAIINH
jgi:hypothetical protein